MSIQCQLQSLRVDIVHPARPSAARGRHHAAAAGGGGGGKKLHAHFHIDTGFEKPALLCDTFSVILSMTDGGGEGGVGDREGGGVGGGVGGGGGAGVGAGGGAGGGAGDGSRPAGVREGGTTHINVSVACTAVAQHVDMPLLRLVHQVTTMTQNVAVANSTQRGSVQLVRPPDPSSEPPAKRPRPDVLALSGAAPPLGADEPSSSPALHERTIVTEITESTPRCWRTMYHLLNIYSSVEGGRRRDSQSKLSVIDEEPDSVAGGRRAGRAGRGSGSAPPLGNTFRQSESQSSPSS